MGRKKLVIVVCFYVSILSCKNYYITSNGGVRPKSSKFELSKQSYKLTTNDAPIDVNSIYVNQVDLNYGGKKDTYKRFLRFFENGRVVEGTSGLFTDSLSIQRINDFDNSGALIGYFLLDKDRITLEFFRVKYKEAGFYTKSYGYVKNDSIFLFKSIDKIKELPIPDAENCIIYVKEKVNGMKGVPDW